MEEQLNLDQDESILLKETKVAHGGTMAIHTDDLILTNKRIICVQRDTAGGFKSVYVYELCRIQTRNGCPKVKRGKLSNGQRTLDIYLSTGTEHFRFQKSDTISNWVAVIQRIFGCDVKSERVNKSRLVHTIENSIWYDSFKELSGEFKSVGNEFTEVGKMFGAAFSNKKEEVKSIENDTKDYVAVEDYKYQLEADEVIILGNEDATIYGSIKGLDYATLLLTNKRIIMEYTTEVLNKKQYHIDLYEFSDIKQYQGIPQIKALTYNEAPALEIFFTKAHIIVAFENEDSTKKQVKLIDRWVEKTIEAMRILEEMGPLRQESANICKNCGAKIRKDSKFCTACGAKIELPNEHLKEKETTQVCSGCGTQIMVGQRFCPHCGTKIGTSAEFCYDNVEKAKKDTVQDNTSPKMPIEKQIEILQKLKSLVDDGILSQEEFEKKKAEIL